MIKLIAISGLYGSGKTTQAYYLAKYMESKGLSVKIVHLESPNLLAYLVWKTLGKLGHKPQLIRNNYGIKFWLLLEIYCLFLKILIIKLISLFYNIIIAEPYIIDCIVTIAIYHVRNVTFVKSNLADLLLRFIPRNSLIIYLNVDAETATLRRIKRRTPNDLGIIEKKVDRWSKLKKPLYDYLASKTGACIINGNLSITEVHKMIVKNLKI